MAYMGGRQSLIVGPGDGPKTVNVCGLFKKKKKKARNWGVDLGGMRISKIETHDIYT